MKLFFIILLLLLIFLIRKIKTCPNCRKPRLIKLGEFVTSCLKDNNGLLHILELFYYKCENCNLYFKYMKTTMKSEKYNKYILCEEQEVQEILKNKF